MPNGTRIKKRNNSYIILDGIYNGELYTPTHTIENLYIRRVEHKYHKLTLTLNITNNILTIPHIGDIKIVLYKKFITHKKYRIMIPFYKHTKIPKIYLDESKNGSRFAETWFQLNSVKCEVTDSFIHFGTYSKGCITIPKSKGKYAETNWNKIYSVLMNSRIDSSTLAWLKIVV